MNVSIGQRQPFGSIGMTVPPIVFGTAALGNVPQVIPEQRKFEICGAWLQYVEPTVFIDAAYRHGDGVALEVLRRMLRRLDIGSEEVVIHLALDAGRVADDWEESCRLLGNEYRPKLVSIRDPDESAWRAVRSLKASGTIRGTGIIVTDVGGPGGLMPSMDWVVLAGGFTVLRHTTKVLSFMAELAGRQIPIIVSGVFEGGFLLGSSRLDGRMLGAEDSADRSLLAWRTSFAALCHGHGVAPAQACIQFALSGPGVVAVLLNSSHPDRVAQNVDFVRRIVPDGFWVSMKEEGLLAADYAYVGR